MGFASPRLLGVVGSGLILAGWLLGSTLSPPVAMTQSRAEPRVTLPPLPPITPVRSLAASALPTTPPAPARNPFAFGAGAPAAAVSAASDARETAAADIDTAPAPPAAPSWQLVGVAVGADGAITAVLSGGGDVHLARIGDRLPDELVVTELGVASARLLRPDGTLLTLRLP